MADKKVNLFIVGAMKAGTTSFVEILKQHPDIYVPPVKEPHYFVNNLPKSIYEPSRFFSLENYLKNEFPKPLHITKMETLEQYNKIYSLHTNQKYLVDASTCYLAAHESAEKIFKYNPKAKIIILKRNPIDRAFSHYTMNINLGREKRSFNQVIEDEILAFNTNLLPWYSYLNMSLYNTQIEKYNTLFNEVLIIDSESLFKNEESVLNEISHFLGIEAFKINPPLHKNKSRSVRYKKLFYLIKKTGIKDYFSKIVPPKYKHKLYKIISIDKTKKPILTPKNKQKLETIIKNHS